MALDKATEEELDSLMIELQRETLKEVVNVLKEKQKEIVKDSYWTIGVHDGISQSIRIIEQCIEGIR